METKGWFVHVEWVVVFITLLGGFYLIDGKIERQGERTDKLYEMFVENQRDIHNLIREIHGRVCEVETKYKVQSEIKELKNV